MINLLVAYDDNDGDLGDYFEQSHEIVSRLTSTLPAINHTAIRGLDCSFEAINLATRAVNDNLFIFAAATHGDSDCLVNSQSDVFIDRTIAGAFRNSFFYSTACCAGSILGPELLQNGCLSFIGYDDISTAPSDENYNALFINCEFYALFQFLSTTNSVQQVYSDMLVEFENQIDLLFESDEIITGIELQKNYYCLILLGNGQLTQNDFGGING
jgi:hypothetical protein